MWFHFSLNILHVDVPTSSGQFSGCVTLVLTRLCTKSLLVYLGRCRIHCWISRINPYCMMGSIRGDRVNPVDVRIRGSRRVGTT